MNSAAPCAMERTSPGATHDRADLLNSWKEIAVFLDRGVRTVQRWERRNGLPAHRYGHSPKAAVFALKSDLFNWLHQQHQLLEDPAKATQEPVGPTDVSRAVVRERFRTPELARAAQMKVSKARQLRLQSRLLRTERLKPVFPRLNNGYRTP